MSSTKPSREGVSSGEVAPPAIQTLGLTKRYGSSVLAVDSLSFTVNRGEIMGFLGPNGAGKTTTIRLILDFIRPTSGRALVFGLDCRRNSLAVHRRVGYLPADLRLYGNLTGRSLLRLFAGLRPGEVEWSYVESLCQMLDISLDRRVGDLSHGNRQKVGLVLALMHHPDLLILDEPTTGLDPIVHHVVLDLLREVRAQGRTVFFSSHVLPEVEQLCDRVAIIREGRLVAVERVDILKGRRLLQMRLAFAEPVPPDGFAQLPGVRILSHSNSSVHLEVAGEVDPVIKAAARYHVVAVETIQPSLEEVFMAYYGMSEHLVPGKGVQSA